MQKLKGTKYKNFVNFNGNLVVASQLHSKSNGIQALKLLLWVWIRQQLQFRFVGENWSEIIFHCLIGFMSILVKNYLCTYVCNCFSKMLRCVTPFKVHIVFKVNVCIRSISKFDIVVILQCSVLVLIQLLRFTLIVLRGWCSWFCIWFPCSSVACIYSFCHNNICQ